LREKDVSAVVLGCTHYPILRRVIQEAVGADVKLIDSGEAAAEVVEALIEKEHLRRTATQELRDLHEAGARSRFLCDDLDHFYVTDAAERFAHVAERFLGAAPRRLEAVEVWGQDELPTR
jgi:glutamate racemase